MSNLTKLWLFLFTALLVPQTRPAIAQKLVRAEFYSKTDGDNKDHDTGVWVTTVTNDTKTVLAEIKDADDSGEDKTEYNDGSEHTIDLVVKSTGSTKSDCEKFKFRVGIQAHGKDKWKVDKASVTLTFDDGTTSRQEVGSFELESKGSKYVETDWKGGQ